MEIKKGMTLEQFVDNEDVVLRDTSVNNCIAERIIYYNRRLIEPLSKEMFVNPLVKPDINMGRDKDWSEYYKLKDPYDEADKKVIFKNFNAIDDNNDIVISSDRKWQIGFNGGLITLFSKSLINEPIKTISDLFRITDGVLELKNFNI